MDIHINMDMCTHIHVYAVICGNDLYRYVHGLCIQGLVCIYVMHVCGLYVHVQISSVSAKPSVVPMTPLAHKTPSRTLKVPLVSQGRRKEPESRVAPSSLGSMTHPSYSRKTRVASTL